MKIVVFRYGTTELSQKSFFPGGDPNIKLSISLLFFLVETEGKRILIDTGCDTMPNFPLFQHQMPVDTLETYGLYPEDITDIIITHNHHDHIDALRHYPNAVVYLHNAGEEKARKRGYLSERSELRLFTESCAVTERLTVHHVGGHSVDSSIVLAETPEGTYVFCGDECYGRENLEKGIPTGSSVCEEKSRAFVEQYGKPGYIPLVFHDPELVKDLGFRAIYDENAEEI